MARRRPKPAKGKTVPLDHPRPVVVGGRLVAVVDYHASGSVVSGRPVLGLLSPADCMRAASALQGAWPGPDSISHEQAYLMLVAAGMPDGGLLR